MQLGSWRWITVQGFEKHFTKGISRHAKLPRQLLRLNVCSLMIFEMWNWSRDYEKRRVIPFPLIILNRYKKCEPWKNLSVSTFWRKACSELILRKSNNACRSDSLNLHCRGRRLLTWLVSVIVRRWNWHVACWCCDVAAKHDIVFESA